MKQLSYTPIPATSILFTGITTADIRRIYSQLGVTAWEYAKGEQIITQGDALTHYWLVISGEAHAVIDHGDGRKTLTMVGTHGDVFGLLFAYAGLDSHPTNVFAAKDTVVLRIPNLDLVKKPDIVNPAVTRQFAANVISVMSKAALRARLRAFVLSHPSVESRIVAYLLQKSKMNGGASEFDIAVDREEMAEFMDVTRCALCSALGKLRDNGSIEFRKRHFKILKPLKCYEY